MSGLKLYYHPLSPPSRFVHILLKDGNIPFDVHVIDLFKGEQKGEEYAKINPNKTVPSLVDGDLVLWESHAIAKYLCDKVCIFIDATTFFLFVFRPLF